MEAERRGDLGQDIRGLDLDDFGTDQRIQGLVEDGDEITYVLRPNAQQAAQQGPATVVVIERQPGETPVDGQGSAVGGQTREGQHNGQQWEPTACRFKACNAHTARPGESSLDGEANGRADRVRDMESGGRAAERKGRHRQRWHWKSEC